MSDLIYGRKPVLEALKSGETIEKMYLQKGERKGSIIEIEKKAKQMGLLVQFCDREKLDQMTEGGNHQGVCVLRTEIEYKSLDDLFAIAASRGEKPFFLLLDKITDPHNYGAMLRTAEVCGCHGVIVPKRDSAPMSAVVHKTSAGASQHIAICRVSNLTDTVDKIKKRNVWVYGADMGGTHYTKTDLKGAIAIVIGAEGSGLSQNLATHMDGILSLPVRGQVDSLNASNACAVLLYEVLRQNDVQS